MPPRKKKSAVEIPEAGDVSIDKPMTRRSARRAQKTTASVTDDAEHIDISTGVVDTQRQEPTRSKRAKSKKTSEVLPDGNVQEDNGDNDTGYIEQDEEANKENVLNESGPGVAAVKKTTKPWQKKSNASPVRQPVTLEPETPLVPARGKKRSVSMIDPEAGENESPLKKVKTTPLTDKRQAHNKSTAVSSKNDLVNGGDHTNLQNHNAQKMAKRPARPTGFSGPTSTFTFKMEVAPDAKDIETKFRKLKELRETRQEKDLREYKVSAQRRFQAADDLIKKLSQEVEAEKKVDDEDSEQLEDLRDQVEQLTSDLDAAISEITVLKAKLESQHNNSDNIAAKSLAVVSDLSGLIVRKAELQDDGSINYDCSQTGRNGVFNYTLYVSNDEEAGDKTISFTPVIEHENDESLLSLLPDYFSEPLSFQSSVAPQFYWKMSQALHKRQ